jgi:hypothetical protein
LIGDYAEIVVSVGNCSEEDNMKTCMELSDLMLLSFIDAGEGVGFEDTLLVSSVDAISLIVASDCLLGPIAGYIRKDVGKNVRTSL